MAGALAPAIVRAYRHSLHPFRRSAAAARVAGLLTVLLPATLATCRDQLVNPPPTASLIVTPGQVIDSAATGSTAQPTRTLAISSTGQGAVIWAAQRAHGAAWLSFDITSGTTPTALSLSFNPASLSPGVYRDTVVLAPTVVPGEATRVPVEFRIQPCTVTPISLDVLVNDSLRTTDCAAPHGTGQFARLYSFHASAGDSVSVYTSASAFGVVLALDSSPSSAAPVLARSADCPLARQSACMVYRLLPQTGTYVVELASAATGQTGKFAVSVVPPHPPLVPDSLGQFQMDSVTPIHVGAAITQATLVFRGVVRDFDLSDSLSLQVEGRPLGSAFTGAPTASGSVVANGARASVAAGGLADNVAYHWQARVLDPTGRASAWVAFGNNPESAADFLVAVPQAPSGPTGASQLQADGTTPIALGGTDDGQSVVLMAMVADPDPNDQLRLEAEAQPVGTPFSNAPTASSTPVANGGTAVVTISGLTDNTAYHWQVRTVDQTALASPWSSFGANPEPDADFRVALAPTRLVVIAQPTNSPAGAAISPAVRVAAQDALGNTLASFTGDVTVTIGTNLMGGALSGATTVTAVAGVATFPRLSINRAGTGYTLQFNTSALATISAAFNVTPAAIAQLVFTQQPTTTIAGNVIAPVIQIAARDSSGNTVTNFTGAVTIGVAANPGGGTLSGTATVAAIGGVATFANLSIDKVAAGYILQASSGAFTASSGAFDIAAAAGAQLRFAVQPTDATAGAAIAPAVTVTAVDPFGNIATSYTGSVTVGLGTNPGGGALAGTSSVAAVAGVARFTALSVNRTGTGYTLSAAAAGVAGATSGAFTITPAGATRLAFTLQPSSSTIAGAAVSPAVQVSAQDGFGNTVPSFTGSISVALGSNPTGGVLAGGTTVAAVNGVASFADLSIATAGTGYTLTATAAAPGVAASTSSAFTITAATANHVAAITSDHQSATAGTAVAVAPAVIVKDQFGNPVAGVSLMFAVTTGGGSLTGTNPVTTNGSGIAAIGSWTLGSLTGTNTVTATASGLTGSPVSFTGTGTAGTVSAAQSTVAVAPAAIPASPGTSTSTITVTARDANGNPISGATVVLTATGTGNALAQPAGPTNASGVATGTLSSSAAGPKIVSATISGVALAQTATVAVSPDEPSGTQSTMSVTQGTIIASSGTSASTITVTVLDALGNAVSGATVTLAATGVALRTVSRIPGSHREREYGDPACRRHERQRPSDGHPEFHRCGYEDCLGNGQRYGQRYPHSDAVRHERGGEPAGGGGGGRSARDGGDDGGGGAGRNGGGSIWQSGSGGECVVCGGYRGRQLHRSHPRAH